MQGGDALEGGYRIQNAVLRAHCLAQPLGSVSHLVSENEVKSAA